MEHHICQSCGMPMTSELFGTEKDGGKNRDYCMYCYENGAYTHPDATLKEMIDICVPYIKEEGKTEAEARSLLERTLPHLKRWASDTQTRWAEKMSFSHFEKQKAKLFSGISTVTSNRDEVSEKGKIPSMWSLYREKFPHTERQDIRRDTIALYSDYETDEHGTYTFSIGTFVDQQEKTANLISLPASEYAVFVSKRGRIAEVVFETWQEIWTWDEKNLRTYTGDYEVYDEQAENPENAQVAIYVAVDRKK
ncbi:zinc ribbon domain-containing protein [Bacillus paralicheniformis]|uniref:zinc ribbon domain-containing protein n=1 Tax=Bacillus paralicheniformis TaxID=1648923 RepID=UPI0018D19A98|nr:zinc ribbon domain-containing protein [Bacillus paralicheniformis]